MGGTAPDINEIRYGIRGFSPPEPKRRRKKWNGEPIRLRSAQTLDSSCRKERAKTCSRHWDGGPGRSHVTPKSPTLVAAPFSNGRNSIDSGHSPSPISRAELRAHRSSWLLVPLDDCGTRTRGPSPTARWHAGQHSWPYRPGRRRRRPAGTRQRLRG
jgi:hypothetical protein